MEKEKIINEILTEWALRSPNGLVDGHDTIENARILNEILAEKGVITPSEKAMIDPLDLRFFEKKGNQYTAKEHPIYNDGTRLEDIKSGRAYTRDEVNKIDSSNKTPATTTSKTTEKINFTAKDLIEKKGFEEEVASKIVKAASKAFDTATMQEFLSKFDSMSPAGAVEFLNQKRTSPRYEAFFGAMDDPKIRRLVKTQVGRGEFILSMLINGCQRTGQKSGDLRLRNGLIVDVKETDDEIFRASIKAFGGADFFKLRFPRAINQLFGYCRTNPDAIEILQNLAVEAGVKDEGRAKFLTYTQRLFEDLDWDSVTSTAVRGLLRVTIHIQKMTPDEVEKAGLKNRVEFDLGDREVVMKIDNLDTNEKNKILNPKPESETVTVDVSPITDKKNELIVPQLKKLEIFAKPSSAKEAFSPESIAEEMFSSMKHYTGGIIFFDQKDGYDYEPDLSNMKRPFTFYLYSQAAAAFKRIK